MSVSTIEMHRRRLTLMAALLAIFGLVLCARLVQWQVVQYQDLRDKAEELHSTREVIPALRGTIYDRNGRVLALTVHDEEAVGDPIHFKTLTVKNQQAVVAAAAPILGMPADEISKALNNGSGHYVRLQATVPVTVNQALKDSDAYPTIAAMPKQTRFYPAKALLAQTLGFVNSSSEGIGIEGSYNQYLKGTPGQRLVEGANYGQGLSKIPVITPAQDGSSVTLTLDMNIQYKAERELENALYSERTTTGTVVILNPKTGELLALAGRPTFDPNDYDSVANSTWNNPVVSDAWEPGSIFKILTFAAALDAGRITPATKFNDRGTMRYRGILISNRDDKAYGTISPAQALQYSSNVAAVQVADVLSTTSFYTYMHSAFGIGEKTEVDLPFEVAGQLRLPGDPLWHISDLAAQSYGQGLSTTPIQMAAAVGAVANKGIMMRPYVVASVSGASETTGGPGPLRRSIKSDTAATMTDWLVSVVETTVTQARVPGYRLAGKTGTALIPPPMGTYDPNETIASFVGYGPAEDPQFVILVRIDRPQVHQTGAEVAAPVFKNIAQWLLTYMKIAPNSQQAQR